LVETGFNERCKKAFKKLRDNGEFNFGRPYDGFEEYKSGRHFTTWSKG
jgi:hypothetical protein